MYDQHHSTGRPEPVPAPDPAAVVAAEGGRALWDATVAALTAVRIDVVQAGDGRPGAVLELGPRGLGVAVRWQPTDQAPLPSGILTVNACSRDGRSVPARLVQNLIPECHLCDAGLRTTYAEHRLVVVYPDAVIP
ncbi:hypothetical protein [Kitasatospora sp. HPMI-4]|uniref:hypothetical protein n=1 Tax=Kitasatospora sp. HPMI-4 TaxID=3448443 RepID=UPI003F19A160